MRGLEEDDISLDFVCEQSVCGGATEAWLMTRDVPGTTIRCSTGGIRERLENAAATAKAAEVYSEAGNIEQARTIVLDVEHSFCEVTTYLNAASLLDRLIS
jgi:hypothetical protein